MCKETMKAVVVPEKVDGSVVVREVQFRLSVTARRS